VWQQLHKIGNETPQGSFLKYTAHEFLNTLKQNGTSKLYEVNASNKKHEIWQRDSLSIEIGRREFAKQKIDYIPVRTYSSAGTMPQLTNKTNRTKPYL